MRFRVTRRDLAEINEFREECGQLLLEREELREFVESSLQEMGFNRIQRAMTSVEIVRKEYKLCYGSKRIPFLVRNGGKEFVIKRYDAYDPEMEKRVLERVQGKVAPPVYFFGSDFIAQGLVDHRLWHNLIIEFGKFGNNNAMRMAAQGHADLARLGVNYCHGHWMDEFHVFWDEVQILDFGTSTVFQEEGEGDVFKFDLKHARYDREDFVRRFPYKYLNPDESTLTRIMEIDAQDAEFVNILHCLDFVIRGLEDFRDFRMDQMQLPPMLMGLYQSKSLEDLFPMFVDYFVSRYNENPRGYTHEPAAESNLNKAV